MKLEQQILNEAQGLPKQALDESLDFVRFVKTEWSEIIQSKNMIRVSVRIKDGVDLANVFTQRLLAKVRRCIDQDEVASKFDQNGRTESAVARIGRMADRAITANGWNAHRRAAAKDGESGFHRRTYLINGPAAPACGPRANALVTSK